MDLVRLIDGVDGGFDGPETVFWRKVGERKVSPFYCSTFLLQYEEGLGWGEKKSREISETRER